jgi:hypothetical protein
VTSITATDLPVPEMLDLSGRASGDASALDDFAQDFGARLPPRINADQTTVEKDLAKLVLALVDIVRRLLERQAGRRVNAGSLTDDEVERMGDTFLKLDRRMEELRQTFGVQEDELNMSLGPIRDLLGPDHVPAGGKT